MSNVLRLMSSCLAGRGARPTVVRVTHAHTVGGRARGSRALRALALFTFHFSLFTFHFSLLTCTPAFAATNSLTYAATFGHYENGAVVRCPISGAVNLTVALYASEEASAQALWSHRLTTTADDGDFVVEISDEVGIHDDTCPNATYSRLDRLFSSTPVTSAYWVEISNVRTNGVAVSDLATGALTRGKITGVPFAVVAARAEAARGAFRVSGKATVSVFKATGRLDVSGDAAFNSSASFKDIVDFSATTVSVTGTLHKSTLEDLGTLEAGKIVASKSVTANVLAITNGTDTTLTPPSGTLSMTDLTVADTLAPSDGTTVIGTLSGKNEIAVTGKLSVPDNATIGWTEGGALSVPDGVYAAGYANYESVTKNSSAYSYKNGTGRNTLSTLSYGAKDTGTEVQIDNISGATSNPYTWAKMSKGAFNCTMLVPLAPNETLKSKNGAVNRFTKELSK